MTAIILNPRGNATYNPQAVVGDNQHGAELAANNAIDPAAHLVDEFAELYLKLAADLDRYELLKKQLSQLANAMDGDEAVTLKGSKHAIDYTKPASSSKCTVSPMEFVMKTQAWDAVEVSVTKAKSTLPEVLYKALFQTVRGSRRLKRVR